MSVQTISSAAASSAQSSAGGQADDFNSRISELTRLEQSIEKMKTEYKSYAKDNSVSQSAVTAKVKQLDSLISKVEQQISEIKRSKKKQSVSGAKKVIGAVHKAACDCVVSTYKKAMSISLYTPAVIVSVLSGKTAVKADAAKTVSELSELKNTEKSTSSVSAVLQNLGEAQVNDAELAVEAAFSSGLDVLV